MPTAISIQIPRSPFHGMLQILRFNWHVYLIACLTISLAILAGFVLVIPRWAQVVVFIASAGAAFWTMNSLLASHWIYDRSEIYRWHWITRLLPNTPLRWANIHAGLDEAGDALCLLYPESKKTTLDIFDPHEMTEPSIAEARKGKSSCATRANFRALPFVPGELETVFLIFAAHEIRRPQARLEFFRELRRVLKPNGRILIVEHLCDWPNFIVFGPGCFHFHRRREWLRLAAETGFERERELGMTPFVRIFLFRKAP